MNKYYIISIILLAIGILYFNFTNKSESIQTIPTRINDTIPETKQDLFKSQLFEPWKEVNGVKDVFKDFFSPSALQSNQYKIDTLYSAHIITIRREEEPAGLIHKLEKYNNLEALQLVEVKFGETDLYDLIQILSEKNYFKKLLISHSNLNELPEKLFEIQSIETLDFSSNKFVSIPERITDLNNLKYLTFESNKKLSSLPENIGNLNQLEFLDVSGTAIKKIPSSIGMCKKLKSCIANASQIEYISEELYKCESLEYLNLSYNRIKEIPFGIGNLTELQSLSLSGNQISNIPETISSLNKIWILSLSKNKLTQFPTMVLNMPNLVNLSLNGNLISSIPKEIADHKMLRGLTISETEENTKDLEYIRNNNSRIRIMTHY